MLQGLKQLIRPLGRSSALAALSAVALLFPATATATAQSLPAAAGHGVYQSTSSQLILEFTFFVKQKSDGSAKGLAVWQGPTSTIVWNVTSSMDVGESVGFAGEILWTQGAVPPGFDVGVTAFSVVTDNGPGSADTLSGLGMVPAAFGNLTIQQIIGILGPPPPEVLQTLLSGNIWTH